MSLRGSELFDLQDLQGPAAQRGYAQPWQERLLVFVLLCFMIGWLSRVVFAVRSQFVVSNAFNTRGRGEGPGSSDDEEDYPSVPLTGVRVERTDRTDRTD